MEVWCVLSWRVAALLLLRPSPCTPITVRIMNQEPVHVIPGSNLLLRAHIQSGSRDQVSSVTWEREAENGPSPTRVRLATCPGSSLSPCTGTRPNVVASRGQQGAAGASRGQQGEAGASRGQKGAAGASRGQQDTTLQVTAYTPEDGGDYVVTVTDQNGNTTSARCIVREYVSFPEAVHHVSVSINVSHSELLCGEAWGTEPHFSWLYNRAAVSQTVGQVSEDGTRLRITQSPICGRFTCRVQNQLGSATATYTADECEARDHSGTAAGVTCVLLLLLCAALLGLLFWRRYQRHGNAMQRLHENMDDG